MQTLWRQPSHKSRSVLISNCSASASGSSPRNSTRLSNTRRRFSGVLSPFADTGWRHIGCIRLQNQGVVGQFADGLTGFARPIMGNYTPTPI